MKHCNLCGSSANVLMKRDRILDEEMKKWNNQEWQEWYLCKKCGNIFPVPNTPMSIIADTWNNNRTVYSEEFLIKHFEYLNKVSAGIINQYWSYIKSKRTVLDVGCGYGNLIMLLNKKGFKTLGIDVDKSTKKYHEKYDLDTIIGSVENIPIEKKFDVIFLNYSIYFISNLNNFIMKCKEHLDDNGILCITMANYLHCANKDVPTRSHTFFPIKESIEVFMILSGFNILSVKSKKGSVYMIFEKQKSKQNLPKINVFKIYLLYKTKKIRYSLYTPIILLKNIVKKIVNA